MAYIYNDEDNAPMHESMLPAEKNCHERCSVSKICWEHYHCKGSHRPDYPFACPNYDRIMDTMSDLPFTEPEEDPEGYEDESDT